MAMNNPYPWVMPTVASANGYGGADPNTGFDPTNPGRQKRRPVASGSAGGIPATPPVVSPATTAATGAPNYQALSRQAQNAADTGDAAVRAATAVQPRFGGALLTDAGTIARGNLASDATINRNLVGVYDKLASAPAQAAPSDTGGIPATPPAVTPAAPPGTPSIPKPTPIFGATPDQMRATGAVPAVPSYETGVTLSDGRKLPIGAMVNGVPTFSDGSGGIGGKPGSIPRTMTDAEIKGLGAQLPTVPAATAPAGFAAPVAFNSDNSDENIANILRSREGGKFGITPEMNAQSDLASIINQDPRSTLGRAAMNASRSANAAGTTLERKAALGALSGLDEGAVRNYLATTSGVNSVADINAQGANALERAKITEQEALVAQEARREQQLQNTNLAGQYRLQAAQMREAPKATNAKDQVSLALNLWQKAPQLLGLDAMGNILDPTTGKLRAPTPQERSALWSRALQMVSTSAGGGTQGLGTAPPAAASETATSTTAKPTFEQVRAAALQQNPNLTDTQIRTYYSAKYGS